MPPKSNKKTPKQSASSAKAAPKAASASASVAAASCPATNPTPAVTPSTTSGPNQSSKENQQLGQHKVPKWTKGLRRLDTAGLIVTILAAVLLLTTELFSKQYRSLVAIAGLQLHVVSALITHLIGVRRLQHQFALSQPFAGGTTFAALKIVGYVLWLLATIEMCAFFISTGDTSSTSPGDQEQIFDWQNIPTTIARIVPSFFSRATEIFDRLSSSKVPSSSSSTSFEHQVRESLAVAAVLSFIGNSILHFAFGHFTGSPGQGKQARKKAKGGSTASTPASVPADASELPATSVLDREPQAQEQQPEKIVLSSAPSADKKGCLVASSKSAIAGVDAQSPISTETSSNNNLRQQQQQKPQDIASAPPTEAESKLAAVLNLITEKTIDRLRPGNTIQHTDAPAYGVRADGELFKQLEEIVRKFRLGKKEYQPLVTLVSLPRQGKTALLDAIGYNREVLRAPGDDDDDDDDDDPDLTRTFVFNMSMNSKWQIEENKTYSFQAAQNEISFRVIATAAGFAGPGDERARQIRDSLETSKPTVAEVVEHVKARIRTLTKSSGFHYFFLFDEFTNLIDQLDENEVVRVKGKRRSSAQALYSSITSLIGDQSAVVVSGFTGVAVKLSGSDRTIRHLVLTPINSTPDRREVSVMRTKFFQGVVDTDPADRGTAIYYYELCKSSRGVFGALLEKLDEIARVIQRASGVMKSDSPAVTSSLSDAVGSLPIIGEIEGNNTEQCKSGASESPFTAMNNVLELKSIQHCAKHFKQFRNDDSLRQRMEVECRDAEELKVAQVPHGKLVWIPRSPNESSIIEVRVEPSFFSILYDRAAAIPDSFFAVFNHMLMQYSYCFAAVSKLDENKPLLQELIYKRWIGASTASSFVVQCNKGISDFVTAHFETISVSNPKLDSISLDSTGDLNGNFFEDAIAVGIAFVFELRQRLVKRWQIQQPIVAPMKDFFISKTTKSPSGTTEVSYIAPLFTLKKNDTDPDPQIEWTQPHNVTSDPIRIVDFDGEFPSNGKPSTKPPPPFTHRTIFRPGRPESNPLVDVVYHEKIHTPASSPPRLVQFWVDGKHSNYNPAQKKGEKPAEIGSRFAKSVARCLMNRLLQQGDCVVDHIVHIIVSPFDASREEMGTVADAVKNEVTRSTLGRLQSYTLYIISPDSVAFQILVSQPVALAIPLMEPQYDNAWATRLHNTASSCYGFKGILVKDVGSQLKSFNDVRDWMRFRYDDDCVSTFINLFESLKTAKESIAAHFSKVPRQLPFGCILEGLKIRPLSWYGGRYHQWYAVGFDLASSNSSPSTTTTATTSITATPSLVPGDNSSAAAISSAAAASSTSSPSSSMTMSLLDYADGRREKRSVLVTNDLAQLLCSNIRVGHLLYDDQVWRALFPFQTNNSASSETQLEAAREAASKRWNQTLRGWHFEQRNNAAKGVADDDLSSAVKERLKQLDYVRHLLSLLSIPDVGTASSYS